MTLFGSRDEDPLLQNDPLAPSDEDAAAEDESTDGDSSAEEAPPEADAAAEADSAPTAPDDRDESVFASGQPAAPNEERSASGDTRILVRSLEETIDGRLTVLSAALDRDWQLAHVEVRRPEALDEASPPGPPSLAFVLRRAGS